MKACIAGRRNNQVVFLSFKMKWEKDASWFKSKIAAQNYLRTYKQQAHHDNVEILGVFLENRTGALQSIRSYAKSNQSQGQEELPVEDILKTLKQDLKLSKEIFSIFQANSSVADRDVDEKYETSMQPSPFLNAFSQNENIKKLKKNSPKHLMPAAALSSSE